MDFFQASILGVVQGVTEFLPISSTGHLVLMRDFLNLSASSVDLSFDAVLHLATALAVLIYFWKDIKNIIVVLMAHLRGWPIEEQEKNIALGIIVGVIPAIVLGFLLEDKIETIFRDPILIAWALIAGGILMLVAEIVSDRSSIKRRGLTLSKSFSIGLFQALALIPGVSRSGATIAGGMLAGLSRQNSTRFSFLLAFPLILGIGFKKFFDLWIAGQLSLLGGPLFFGFLASLVVGLLAIHFLVNFVRKFSLNWFVLYRFILASLILIVFL